MFGAARTLWNLGGPALAGWVSIWTRVRSRLRVDYRDVEHALLAAGWIPCGAGDWAIALRSPDGTAAARISPFDPTGPYTAALYRQAAHTRQVPELFTHNRLIGGGDLQVMEWLRPVAEDEAVAFHQAIARRAPEVADLVDIVRQIHERARRELPWCGPLDHNPANVMRAADGRLVVADLFFADGPNLYATAATDPDLIAARIPEAERRFMTEIPLAASGPWEPGAQEAMRVGLAAADARKGTARSLFGASGCALSPGPQAVDVQAAKIRNVLSGGLEGSMLYARGGRV